MGVATASGEEKNYETKCYVVDDSAHLSYAPSFDTVTDGNYRDYQSVGLGRFEGGVMLDLVKKGSTHQSCLCEKLRCVLSSAQGFHNSSSQVPRISSQQHERLYSFSTFQLRITIM